MQINQSAAKGDYFGSFLREGYLLNYANAYTIDLPKMGYPFRLFLAAVASPTSLNTTKACPRILLLRFATIWRISP